MKADVTPFPSPLVLDAGPTLRERLSAVAGLDVGNGLGRVRGNEDKYGQVLALFVRGHEADPEKIAEALHCGEMGVAEQLAHALKGTAGLIGATAVAGAAAALLSALQQKTGREAIDQGYAELATQLGQLIASLKQAQDGEPNRAALAVIDTGRGAEVLRTLEACLASGDMAASSLARRENQLLRAVLGEAAEAVLSAIEVFDFEAARLALRAATGKPHSPA